MTPTKFYPRLWVLALVLSACASGADVTAEPTTTTRVLATTITTTTTIPQPMVPESVECIIGEQGRATNVPGTYQILFDPPFVMTLPDDWTADVLNDHYAYFRWAGSGFGLGDQPLVAVQIFDTLVEPDDPEQSLETPANLIRNIESHPGMLAQAPQNVVVARVAGRSIEFQIIQLDGDGNQVRIEFGRSGDDIAVGFDAQWDVRLITLDLDGETVVITVEVPCCHRLEDFMHEADELIDSIVFASVAAASQQAIDDGGTWTRLPSDVEGRDHGVFGSVIEGGDGLVAGGWSDDGLIWTSTDGQSWWPVLGPKDSDLVNGIFPAADGLVAVGTRITEIIGVAPMGDGAVLVGYDTSSGHEQQEVMIWSSQ